MTLALLLTAVTGAWAEGETATITLTSGQTVKTYENVTLPWSTTAEILKEVVTGLDFNVNINAISGGDGKVVKYGNENFTVTGTFSGDATVTVTYNTGSSATITVTAPKPLMTLSDDGKTATMESMPAFDATAEFDLVRDMNDETYPVAFSGLPEPAADTGVAKIVVKKNSSTQKFEFLNAITIALIDPLAATDAQNIIEADGITIKVLVGAENGQGAIDYDQDNPITLAAFLADTQPGYYWIKAVPTDETTSPYIGTVYSSELLLIKGYEVTVPAGEYITYYRDEPLYADPVSSTDAQLYTISSVSTTDGTATLSDAIATAPSSTPLLVYNSNTSEDKTFLLIPADAEPNLALTVAPEFIGTTEATTIAASTTTVNNYALNGKQFVWVKNAISIAANKAYLSISNSNARTINLVSDSEATGIRPIDNGQLTIDNWYDLSGRKVATPSKKGVYIQNGKKVVVK